MSKLRVYLVQLMEEIGERSGCHRLPERSFFFRGRQFPVCARCTGVAAGQLLAVLVSFFAAIPYSVCLLYLSIMGLDWGLQEMKILQSTNRRRFLTGIFGGFGWFGIYCNILKKIYRILLKK